MNTNEICFNKYPDTEPPTSYMVEYLCATKWNEFFICKWDDEDKIFYSESLNGLFRSDLVVAWADTDVLYQAFHKQINCIKINQQS